MADLEAHYTVLRMLSLLTGRRLDDPEHISLIMSQDPESLVQNLIDQYGANAFNAALKGATSEIEDYGDIRAGVRGTTKDYVGSAIKCIGGGSGGFSTSESHVRTVPSRCGVGQCGQ